METSRFSFDLPQELIAQHPTERRDDSRLLLLDRDSGAVRHRMVSDLAELIPRGSVVVVNDSKVRKARVYAHVPGERRDHEFLFIEPEDSERTTWTAMARKPRKVQRAGEAVFPEEKVGRVVTGDGHYLRLRFEEPLGESYFESHGHVPLPPYIERDDEPDDESRYQTVYAREPGSVAAPTAGLHLTQPLLHQLRDRGIRLERVELRVGPGTFLPVRTEHIEDHVMHEEWCELDRAAAERLNVAVRDGRRVIAVGTTSVRTLESAFSEREGALVPFSGRTALFIRPGYRFRVVSGILTNFHTPGSTLLMLVCAFAGIDPVLSAYRQAVAERYRFFSYGDAMLIV